MMHHYVYKITNKINGKFYIGIKSSKLDFLNTNYYGSGNLIIAAVKKYGKENFLREVLFEFKTREEASDKEAELVNTTLVISDNCYNISIGGNGKILKGNGVVPIKSMDSTGNVIYYPSILDAATTNNGYTVSGIRSCLSGRSIKYKSLYWALTAKDFLIRDKNYKCRTCFSIDKTGVKKSYKSLRDAQIQTGICHKKIQDCISLRRKSAGGLTWYDATSKRDVYCGFGRANSYKSINENGDETIYNSLKEAANSCNLSKSSIINSIKRSGKAGRLKWEKINA